MKNHESQFPVSRGKRQGIFGLCFHGWVFNVRWVRVCACVHASEVMSERVRARVFSNSCVSVSSARRPCSAVAREPYFLPDLSVSLWPGRGPKALSRAKCISQLCCSNKQPHVFAAFWPQHVFLMHGCAPPWAPGPLGPAGLRPQLWVSQLPTTLIAHNNSLSEHLVGAFNLVRCHW